MGLFRISTKGEESVTDITEQVETQVKKSRVQEGLCVVYVCHATAALTINESADPNVGVDLITALNAMIEKHGGWLHDRVDNNAHAHIKAAIIGPSVTIPIEQGRLTLGTWQGIMLCCFDGPRERTIKVKILEG